MGEMSRRAIRAGYDLSTSRISQIANNKDVEGRLPPDTIKALAKALDVTPERVAQLDDERFGIGRRYVAAKESDLTDASIDDLLKLQTETAAEIARRLEARNPEAKK